MSTRQERRLAKKQTAKVAPPKPAQSAPQVRPENIANWERFRPILENSEDWQAIKSFKGPTTDSTTRRIRYMSLAQLVRQISVNKIPGAFAECGCAAGHSAHVIATTMTRCGIKEPLHIFDSFEGLSPATEVDFVQNPHHPDFLGQQAALRQGMPMFSWPMERVKRHLAEHSFITYNKGWIPAAFPPFEGDTFAFAHIDVDLYQPTKDALEFFYPRLSKGGMIQFDDYAVDDWPGAQKAVDEFIAANRPSFFYILPLGGGFLIK